ncbi:MAG: DUF308 domain-containing protein [Halioglobus sp.]
MSPIDEQQKQQLKDAAINARTQVQDGFHHFCRSLQLKAALLVVVGLSALFWPSTSMKYLAMFVGVCSILDGIGSLVSASRGGDLRSYLGSAVISLVIGGVLLFWPNSIAVLLKLFGALVLYIGVRNFLFSRQMSDADPERSTVRGTGMLALVIGLVLLLWPGIGIGAISWILGIAALLVAALLFFIVSRLQRATSQLAQ